MKEIFKTAALFSLLFFANTFFAQEDKLVELTTTGTGKTKDAAIQIALRSAIEQAFGVFISSKTEVLNDELLTDQIISVSNGNIQHYDIISEMPIDNNTNYVVTVKSKVSISKLTNFIESKGIEVEFKGAVFAMNIKQQMLNEQSELKSIKEMVDVLKNISDRSFDFEVEPDGEPTASKTQGLWDIPLKINIKLNSNFENYKNYFQKTLQAISMSEQDAKNYIELNKPIYSIMMRNKVEENLFDTLIIVSNKNKLKNFEKLLLDKEKKMLIKYQCIKQVYDQTRRRTYFVNIEEVILPDANNREQIISEFINNLTVGGRFNLELNDTVLISAIPTNKPLYFNFYLRNKESLTEIQNLIFYFIHSIQNFVLDDGSTKRTYADLFSSNAIKYFKDIFHIGLFIDGLKIQGNRGPDLSNEDDLYKPLIAFEIEETNPKWSYTQLSKAEPYNKNSGNLSRFWNLTLSDPLIGKKVSLDPYFPALPYNFNDILRKSSFNIVLQFNELCNDKSSSAKMKIVDKKTIDELNKLSNYKIYSNK